MNYNENNNNDNNNSSIYNNNNNNNINKVSFLVWLSDSEIRLKFYCLV